MSLIEVINETFETCLAQFLDLGLQGFELLGLRRFLTFQLVLCLILMCRLSGSIFSIDSHIDFRENVLIKR